MSDSNTTLSNNTNMSVALCIEMDNLSHPRNWTNASICSEQDIVNEAAPEIPEYIIRYYLVLIVAAVGLFGNVSAIVTLVTMKPLLPSSIFMIALAVADSLVLTVDVITINIIRYRVWLGNAGCKIMNFLVPAVTRLSNWILVAFTIERCVAIVSPLKTFSERQRIKIIIYIAIISLITVGVSVIYLFVYDEGENISEFHLFFHTCSLNPQYVAVLNAWNWLEGVLQSLLPLAIISILNMVIISRLRDSSKMKGKDFQKGGQERQATVMLITACVMFCILTVPFEIFNISELFWTYEDSHFETRMYHSLSAVAYVLVDVNHAINFYLYIWSGKRFRCQFLKIICGK